jgi:transposase InsO family protein
MREDTDAGTAGLHSIAGGPQAPTTIKEPAVPARLLHRYRRVTHAPRRHGNFERALTDPLVDRDFTATVPGTRLVGDITYLRTWEGWLYLAPVIDWHSKRVLGWSMAEHMRTDLICDAITMAATNVEFAPGTVFHSDPGQYTSEQSRTHLAAHGLSPSIGRTGVCWDNAMAESFHGVLKNELVYRTVYPTRRHARADIAEYIEVFYNRRRLHSALGYRTR